MINAYKEKRDLYAVIASLSFNVPYEDCLEFYPEGTKIKVGNSEVVCGYKTHKNETGKDRRTSAKSILLGVLYGRGAASVGEQIHKTKEEAQDIIDKFFNAFPKMHKWINDTIDNVYKTGYVEDIAFRRRRLPDILLPKYELKDLNEQKNITFNPFLICEDRKQDNKLIDKYKSKLEKIKSRKDYEKIQQDALNEGIEIHDNTGFIAQAERQAVNSRVQGGAATLTKNALLALYNNKRLKEIGAYLVNTVHDEILIEAPDEYAEEAANILTSTMISSAKKYVTNVPMECDAYCVKCWYLDEFFEVVKDEFNKLLKKNNNDDLLSFEQMCEERQESTREQIYEIVHQQMTHRPEGVETYYN
jgi:DNA polymerase I-like protein with 3'-5' exonuclease and polymerase domains